MIITNLRCCLFTSPIGLHSRTPDFSWELSDPKPGSSMQKEWRVVAWEGALEGGDSPLWDSGWVTGNQSTSIRYAGRKIESRMTCNWKVFVRDESNRQIESAVATWTVGLLEPSDWSAHWIGRDSVTERPTDPFVGAFWIWDQVTGPGEVCFEKTFCLEEACTGFLWGLADDEAEVEINGTPVCDLLRAQSDSNLFPIPLRIETPLRAGENRVRIRARKRHDRDPHAGVIFRLLAGGAEVVETSREFGMDIMRREWRGGLTILSDGSWTCQRGGADSPVRVLGSFGVAPWNLQSVIEYPSLPARYLRREFSTDRPAAKAMLYFSGLGLSEAWINGVKVGDEVLSPHATDYNTNYFYRAFDVTGLLREGANAIGCILGNGRYFAPRARIPFPMESYGCPRLLLQLEITSADGTTTRLVSDSSWSLSASGPIGWNNEFDGEHYDARKEDPAWALPGFSGEAWSSAGLVAAPLGRIAGQSSAPIRVTERFAPINSWKTKFGTTIYDFGCNLVGWTRLQLEGRAGEIVMLRHAENLESKDVLATENLRSALCTNTITLREGITDYEPKFTYHGFRYMELRGNAAPRNVEACFVHDEVDTTGAFTCSNDLVNKIVEASARGIRGNYRSMPTDCPQRDERMGWLGDRAGGAPGEMFLFDVSKLYSKWMDDICFAQTPSGCVPDIAPPFWRMFTDTVTWPSCVTFIPHWLLRHYGDTGTVERSFEAMRRWLDHLCGYLDRGLIDRDIYGDWCVPPESPHLIHSERADRKTHPTIMASCFLARNLEMAAEFAKMLGRQDLAASWLGTREKLRDALNARFYNPAKGCYDNGAQTAALLPLAFNLVPESEKARVFQFLISKIYESGQPVLGTGLIGGQWLLRTLTAYGRADIARALVTRDEYPSWGYMIREGATTIWELWNGNTADPLMNSGNHVMLLGDLLPWLFEDVAGIQPRSPGFASVGIRPRFLFDEVSCRHQTVRGPISSRWKSRSNVTHWEIEIPANVSASVELPAAVAGSLKKDGRPLEGLAYHGEKLVTIPVGPGKDTFTFDTPDELAG